MKYTLITIVLLLLIVPIVFIAWSFFSPDEPAEENISTNPFPETPEGTTGTPSTQVPDIAAIIVRPQTQALGDEAYTLQEDQTNTSSYSITYAGIDNSYHIVLYTTPLSEARQAAEAELLSILNIEKDAVCNLRIRVATPISVSAGYSDRDLGLSFCPGAVALP